MTRTIIFKKELSPRQIDELSCQEIRDIDCDECELCSEEEQNKITIIECKEKLKEYCY